MTSSTAKRRSTRRPATWPDWSPAERRAARVVENLTVSQWAEAYRVIAEGTASKYGKWRNDFAPHLVGMMDAFCDPNVEMLAMMLAAQVGKTEVLLNCLCYVADVDPGPALLVMPDEDEVAKIMGERVEPTCRATPRLARQLSKRKNDNLKDRLRLERMTLFTAGAGSTAALASRAIRYLFCTEVDKFPRKSGKEADPVMLAHNRTKTFRHDRKTVIESTPTTVAGLIFREFELGDQRRWHVPCPHCGVYQQLLFSQVKWPEGERHPDTIMRKQLAWYECVECQQPIPDDEVHKRKMNSRGVWVPKGAEVDLDGVVHGAVPSSRASFQISALVPNWQTWSEVVAQFLRSKDDRYLLMDFVNSWLGEPFAEQDDKLYPELIEACIDEYPAGSVPKEAVLLTAGVDVQKGLLYWVVRAWGRGMTSWLVAYGVAPDFAALENHVVKASWPRLGGEGKRLQARYIGVDTGYRTDESYAFAVRHRARVLPTKGQAQIIGSPVRPARVELNRHGRGLVGGIVLMHVDTNFFKDQVARHIRVKRGEHGAWRIHADPGPDYCRHLVSEHKVLLPQKKQHRTSEWQPRPGGAANHWWDCEVIAAAMAHHAGVYTLQPKATDDDIPAVSAPPPRPDATRPARSGWLSGVRATHGEPPRRRERGGWI